MEVYKMGACGIAVTVEACKKEGGRILVTGWHQDSEKEAVESLISKLETMQYDINKTINKLKQEVTP